MITIFYETRRLILSENVLPEFTNVFNKPNSETLKMLIENLLNKEAYHAQIIGDEGFYLKQIKKEFTSIKAAGGAVLNANGELLMIKRLGKWDLPKGKIEKGEHKADAAIREVEEECGISDLTIVQPLNNTYHIYYFKEQWVLKTSYWYLMHYKGNEILKPQIEENITEVVWKNLSKLGFDATETYPSIEMVLYQLQSVLE
jgi:8-oxo-dGTP pyrophosphatase MutT (NUDIX family)